MFTFRIPLIIRVFEDMLISRRCASLQHDYPIRKDPIVKKAARCRSVFIFLRISHQGSTLRVRGQERFLLPSVGDFH